MSRKREEYPVVGVEGGVLVSPYALTVHVPVLLIDGACYCGKQELEEGTERAAGILWFHNLAADHPTLALPKEKLLAGQDDSVVCVGAEFSGLFPGDDLCTKVLHRGRAFTYVHRWEKKLLPKFEECWRKADLDGKFGGDWATVKKCLQHSSQALSEVIGYLLWMVFNEKTDPYQIKKIIAEAKKNLQEELR